MTVYSIDQTTGYLSYVQNIATRGQQPRFITVTPDNRQLIAANELSDTLTVFEIDEESGKLQDTGKQIATESPVCVVFKTDI